MKHVAGLSALMITLATAAAWGQHYVSADGSNEYPYHTLETAAHRIEDAIQAGLDEYYATFVWVAEGRYQENIVIPPESEVYALVPGSCIITPERAGQAWQDVAVVTVEYGAQFSGFVVDAQGCGKGIVCNGGTVRECRVFGADRGAHVNGGFVEGCTFLHNSGAGMYVSDVTVVYDTVAAANNQGVVGINDEGYTLLAHCTISANWSGIGNLDCMLVSMRDCIVWGNFEWDGAWDPVCSDITFPDFIGINGNISAEPLFVGWGDFNDADNPTCVDCSNTAEEDGSKESPFRTIRAALTAYDFHLAVGSPCVGAASDGLNMGAYPEDVPSRQRSPSVLINVAPGTYNEGNLMLHDGTHLRADTWGGARIIPPEYKPAASMQGASSIQGLSLGANLSRAITCAPGSTPLIAQCRIFPHALHDDRPAIFASWPTWRTAARPRIVGSVMEGFDVAVSGGALLEGCTLAHNKTAVLGPQDGDPPEIRNSIIWCAACNGAWALVNIPASNISHCLVSDPSLDGVNGNIFADPQFVDAQGGDLRLLPTSPCIDSGDNASPYLPETDIAGMHRIMYGGKSLTVDMGAYEFYINNLEPIPGTNEAVFTWSSLEGKTYSIFYTDDLFNWHTAIDNFPSSGNQTTSWTDDGTLTGIPPLLAPKRFYRLLENP
jgi:hypothetical protein